MKRGYNVMPNISLQFFDKPFYGRPSGWRLGVYSLPGKVTAEQTKKELTESEIKSRIDQIRLKNDKVSIKTPHYYDFRENEY
jgi:hypothetical protein